MRLKRYPAVVTSLLLLAGCNSDGNEVEQNDPFIVYRVNGELAPTEVSVNWDEDVEFAPCNEALYANAAQVLAEVPEYCVSERSSVVVSFVIRFINDSLESTDLQFSGLGYRIQIFEYDADAEDLLGTEVWNSDYVEQSEREGLRSQGETLDDYDPSLAQLVTLGPAESYPLQTDTAITLLFVGNSNIADGFAGAEFDPQGLSSFPSDGAGTPLCDWSLVENSSGDATYERVQCLGEPLLPLPSANSEEPYRYWIRTRFNFNDWQEQPEDVLLTINPPA